MSIESMLNQYIYPFELVHFSEASVITLHNVVQTQPQKVFLGVIIIEVSSLRIMLVPNN